MKQETTTDQLYAFPDDQYRGDCGLDLALENSIECVDGETYSALLDRWTKRYLETNVDEFQCAEELLAELDKDVVGFFVFTASAMEAALCVFPIEGVGNDTALYGLIAATNH